MELNVTSICSFAARCDRLMERNKLWQKRDWRPEEMNPLTRHEESSEIKNVPARAEGNNHCHSPVLN